MEGDNVCYSSNLTLCKYHGEGNNFVVESLLINETLLQMSRLVVGVLCSRYHWRKSYQIHSTHVSFALH